MPHVPLKNLKQLIIQSACHIIKYAQPARHVSILSSQLASGSKTK